MRECVKNWEDTTPGTVRGKPAHSQLQHSLHPRKRGGWARRSDGRFVTNRMKRLQGMAIAICHENGIPVRIISLDDLIANKKASGRARRRTMAPHSRRWIVQSIATFRCAI